MMYGVSTWGLNPRHGAKSQPASQPLGPRSSCNRSFRARVQSVEPDATRQGLRWRRRCVYQFVTEKAGDSCRGDQNAGKTGQVEGWASSRSTSQSARQCGHLVVQCLGPRGVSHLFCVAHLSEINHVLVFTCVCVCECARSNNILSFLIN